MLIIAEKINATKKEVKQAIENKDTDFIKNLAQLQADAGANFIDVNVGTGSFDKEQEKEAMVWIIRLIQEITTLPLCIDSADANIIEVGLDCLKGKENIINSVNAEDEKLETILPLVKKYNTKIIALTMDKEGIPPTVEGRIKTAYKILKKVEKMKINPEQIYFDPLVIPVSTDTQQGVITLKTLAMIKKEMKPAKTVLGLSNISFGLPQRTFINQAFLIMAMYIGLDAVILDILDKRLMSSIKSVQVVLGEDEYCMEYIKAYRKGILR